MDWHLRPARDHALSTAQRLRSTGREPGLMSVASHHVWLLGLRAYLSALHRFRVVGCQLLPEPPFVLVANHGSHLDAMALAACLPQHLAARTFSLAAGEVFFDRIPAAGFAAMAINALPVWRKRTSADDLAFFRRRLVEDRLVLVMFPEGTRSRTGEMARFRPGIGALVAGSTVPVVPCHIDGAHAAWPPGRRLPRPGRVTVRVGEALVFPDTPQTRDGWLQVAAACEAAVRDLAPA